MRERILTAVLFGLAMWPGIWAGAESLRAKEQFEGVIVLHPGQFEVDMRLDLVATDSGSLRGHLSYPFQGPKEYALDTIQWSDDHFLITSTDEQGIVSVFQGRRLQEGKVLRGELTENGRKASFELHRIDSTVVRKAPVVQSLSPEGSELKTLFNQDQGQVRVLLVLSPSCNICRMGARLVERHLLENLHDPKLSVYIVWERISTQDSLESAIHAASLLSNEQIQHFWSAERFASTAFQVPVGIQRDTAWDVFLVFGKEKTWTFAPPAFDVFMHNQKMHDELPKDRLLNAEKLAGEVKDLLDGVPAQAASR